VPDTRSAREVIQETADAVIHVLQTEGLSSAQRRQRIKGIARDRFDFRTMSRLVLKRDWKRLSRDQQREFVDEFRSYLSHSYGSRLERYEQQTVQVEGEHPEPRGDVTVQTRIHGGSVDGAEVDYRLRQRKGRWRIIDVIIEGVSLVSNFRSQFAEVLDRGGPEELLRRLREKNAQARTPRDTG